MIPKVQNQVLFKKYLSRKPAALTNITTIIPSVTRYPGEGFCQLAHSTASDKSDVMRVRAADRSPPYTNWTSSTSKPCRILVNDPDYRVLRSVDSR